MVELILAQWFAVHKTKFIIDNVFIYMINKQLVIQSVQ